MSVVQQTGDFSYASFEGAAPLATPVESISQGIRTLDARHYEAIDTMHTSFANVKLANINAADEPYRRELLANAQSAIESEVRNGNYAYALNEAKRQARAVTTDEGLLNRQKTNEEYQDWRTKLINNNDYSPEMREWLLSKNQYAFGETITPEGNTIRKTWDEVKRETGRAEAKQIPVSDMVAQALKYVKPETLGGESILFKTAEGGFTTDMNQADPANPLPYLKTGSQVTQLTEDKIRNATMAYINSNADAKASLRQEYDFLMDTNQEALIGPEGVLMDLTSFTVNQITGLAKESAFRNSVSSQNPLDGMRYAAERRLARLNQTQEQVKQTPYSGYPVNTNVKTIEDYNKLNDKVQQTGSDIIRRMTALGISDFGDELTESDMAKLAHVNSARLGMTTDAVAAEKARIQRLANDYFIDKQRLDIAKSSILPKLSQGQRDVDDFISSISRGDMPDYQNNKTASIFKDNFDNFIRNGGKIVYNPGIVKSATRNIEKELDAAGVEYTKDGRTYEITPTIENLYKFNEFNPSGGLGDSQVRAINIQPDIYNNGRVWHPQKQLKSIMNKKNDVNKQIANTVSNMQDYSVNATAFDLKAILPNDEAVADVKSNALAALRNSDARAAIRVYASDAKNGLNLQGDGLEGKLKNEVFDTFFTGDKDVDIRIIPNGVDGRPILALTATGTPDTKTKDGVPNRTFYIDGGDLFNTVLNPVTSSPAYVVSSDLARLDISAHNSTVTLPATFAGIDDGTMQYSNLEGRRVLMDNNLGATFVGSEIDNLIGASRIVDNQLAGYASQNVDFVYQRENVADALQQNPLFIQLVNMYTDALYGQGAQTSDKIIVANKLYDRFTNKYK